MNLNPSTLSQLNTKLYLMARFNIMAYAKSLNLEQDQLWAAYAYAWSRQVYPINHDHIELHQPFSAQFCVTAEMMDELCSHIEASLSKKKPVTFRNLEERYVVEDGDAADFDPDTLLYACRYLFLSGSFTEKFWRAFPEGLDKDAADAFADRAVTLNF